MPYEVFDREKLRELKTFAYWATLIVWLSIGAIVTLELGERAFWPGVRFFLYREIALLSREKLPQPRQTSLVLIHDNAYWGKHRTCSWRQDEGVIPRDYFGQLIRTIAKSNPSVIAFDFFCPIKSGYDDETADLIDAIRRVGPTTTVVIPAAIDFPTIARRPTALDELLQQANVVAGFTRLENDLRRMIISAEIDRHPLDSFAVAAVRPTHQLAGSEITETGEAPFAVLLSREKFRDVTIDAEDLLNGRKSLLPHRIVIIGADWHPDLSNTNVLADTQTIGGESLPGAMVHASYIESMLARIVRRPAGTATELLFDALFGLLASVALLCGRGVWKLILLGLVALLLFPAMYFAWVNIGIFFDAIPTSIAIAVHTVIERKKNEWYVLRDPVFVSLIFIISIPFVIFLLYERHTPRVPFSSAVAHVVAVAAPLPSIVGKVDEMKAFTVWNGNRWTLRAKDRQKSSQGPSNEVDRAAAVP